MRIAIVEDEALIARRLKRLLTEILGTDIDRLRCLPTLDDALEYLDSEVIDLLFLDLNLYGEDGFDLLEQAVAGSFHTIVVSAYTEQAIRAFDYGVLDFVPKPFDRRRLEAAVDRARAVLRSPTEGAKVLAIRRSGIVELVETAKVLYLRGSGNYAELVMEDGRSFLHDKTLDRLEQLLPPRFLRVHRSYLVDTQRITAYRTYSGGRWEALLGEEAIPVSRGRIAALRECLEPDS